MLCCFVCLLLHACSSLRCILYLSSFVSFAVYFSLSLSFIQSLSRRCRCLWWHWKSHEASQPQAGKIERNTEDVCPRHRHRHRRSSLQLPNNRFYFCLFYLFFLIYLFFLFVVVLRVLVERTTGHASRQQLVEIKVRKIIQAQLNPHVRGETRKSVQEAHQVSPAALQQKTCTAMPQLFLPASCGLCPKRLAAICSKSCSHG